MDETKTTWLTLPFPLIGGGMAQLNVPIPLSEKNYTYLVQLLNATLTGMKEAIVADLPQTATVKDA